jgi:hypothetical protein
VEANLLNQKAKLKAEDKDRIEEEWMTSSEVKLDVLENTVREMMQRISRKDELVVQMTTCANSSRTEKDPCPQTLWSSSSVPWFG